MLLHPRRSYIRYLLVCALLIGVYLVLLPWDNQNGLSTSSLKQQFKGSSTTKNEEHRKEGEEIRQKLHEQLKQDIVVDNQKQDTRIKDGSKEEKLTSNNNNNNKVEGENIDMKQYFKGIFDIYSKHWPDVGFLDNYKDGKKAQRKAFEQKYPIYSNKELGEFLQVEEADLKKLRESHEKTIKDLPDSYPEGLFKGTGIVTVAGKHLMPVLVGTMRMLRRVSPNIPVEVFMADDEEYEPEICEQVLPALNVKCRVLKREFGEELWSKFQITGYQLKVLSMLASSFEDNLFLDADSIPLHDVEILFKQEPYTSNDFVLWPDFWFRTTSPHFYDIAGIKLGGRVRGDLSVTNPDEIPQADLKGALPDKSTESGQIMFNKKNHFKALLLATYYNLHSRIFYPIFTQGVSGEGDKETFIAALVVLGDKFYQMKADTRPAGYFDEKREFHGTGMLQALPNDDYRYYELKSTKAKPRIQFMHLNYPKVNARDLMYSETFGDQFNKDGSRARLYGKPSGNYWVFDYKDIEYEIWKEHEWMVCELGVKEQIQFNDWRNNKVNVATLCEDVKKHVKWLESTHDT